MQVRLQIKKLAIRFRVLWLFYNTVLIMCPFLFCNHLAEDERAGSALNLLSQVMAVSGSAHAYAGEMLQVIRSV